MNSLAEEEDIDDDERGELEREAEQLGQYDRDRRDEPREINLSIEACIGLESAGNSRQTLGEILPEAYTTEVEDRLRDVVGRDTCDAAKDDDVHEHREQRRDEIPSHAEDGLLELHRDVSLDKQPDEVLLTPQFYQSQPLGKTVRRDLCSPIWRSYCFNDLMI